MREWINVHGFEDLETLHNEIVEIMELPDDRVFTENVVTGRTGSGVPVELRYWSVLWVAEGKLARRQVSWNRDEALEAAGLSE